ncbi:MAG: N-6 DNA methylase, partial [Planctomycetaceae bacterium]|nr:N-6 DNA methylase [Planctomycetaceae bacterium]
AQGEKYRPGDAQSSSSDDDDADDDNDDSSSNGISTSVEWIERIEPGQFYLRVGLGRKASGSYYTPHSFVRFLVQETLGPQVEERSPQKDPNPLEILKLKVLDPAMGSGHFLVEACRYLGHHMYEACRLCDEKAMAAERRAESGKKADRDAALEEAAKWRQRVIDLPDPDDEMLKYLPSRSPEGEETGYSQQRAEALCRRLVSTHCLYGVDKNPLAVELAKLALWLESHAEGMPLTFLDHRLVIGDSLTGPFWEKLVWKPGHPDQLIEDLFSKGLNLKIQNSIREAIRYVQRLDARVGVTVAEVQDKQAVKEQLDGALLPFRVLVAAWTGNAMLGEENSDDGSYAELLQHIASHIELPQTIECETLRTAIAMGLGLTETPLPDADYAHLLEVADCVPALSYDLTFPEVFYPTGVPVGRQGFNAIVGNPPWDRIEVDPQAYFGQLDFRVIESENGEERDEIIADLQSDERINEAWTEFTEQIEHEYRTVGVLYEHQTTEVAGRNTLGRPDLYRVFVERGVHLIRLHGMVGWVVPSSFHANEGATGVRRLYLNENDLSVCYSFENRKKLFEIDSRFKFAAVVARKHRETTKAFRAGFYLHDDEWLFVDDKAGREIQLTPEIVSLTGGPYLTFCEARSPIDLGMVVAQCRSQVKDWAGHLKDNCIKTAFGVEIHRNPEFAKEIVETGKTRDVYSRFANNEWLQLPICAGKTMHQFTDEWDSECENCVDASDACATRHWKRSVPFFRFAFRMKAASTNERTLIAAVLTPGFVCEQTLAVESEPYKRPNANALATTALANSFQFDFQVRQRVTTSLSNYILAPIPIPNLSKITLFLAHSALRLSCNHDGYGSLWREQLHDEWREPLGDGPSFPVMGNNDERWKLRASIDAVVADAYCLTREQYEHVLSTFSHSSYPSAPELCLAAFDELKDIGLEAFTKKHDPYHDIPLNENLPEPVINLPIPGEETDTGEFKLNGAPKKSGAARKT